MRHEGEVPWVREHIQECIVLPIEKWNERYPEYRIQRVPKATAAFESKSDSMDTSKLRKFASFARSALIEQVGTRLKNGACRKEPARRESPNAVKELEGKDQDLGEKRLIETVHTLGLTASAHFGTWMSIATRESVCFRPQTDSSSQRFWRKPKMGHIDEDLVPAGTRKRVLQLLDGADPSYDPQGEAYRLLLVAVCNYYHALMPFMFEKIADYTELLLQMICCQALLFQPIRGKLCCYQLLARAYRRIS